ncbi:hypothetical protein V6N13_041399 [Hibiscus sabdariffa]
MNAEEDERIRNQQQGRSKCECVSLFVFNLPEKLHWQGLWTLFSYHEVVDAFILNKRSNDGYRFGFVRYNSMDDALRAIDRLDIFTIYNYKVRFYLVRNQY